MTPWAKDYDARMREHLSLLRWWRRPPQTKLTEALGGLDRSSISRRLSGAIAFKSWEPAAMLRAMGVDQREFVGGLWGDLHAEVYLARIAKGNRRQKSYADNDLMADGPTSNYTEQELRRMADGLHDLRVADPEAARLQALEVLRSAHHYDVDPGVESRLKANLSLGGIYRARGAYATAAVFLLKALDTAGHNQCLKARLHHAIVPLASDLGDFDVGLQAAQEAAASFKSLKDRLWWGRVLLSKGNLLGQYGHLAEAIVDYRASLSLITDSRWYDRYYAFLGLALCYVLQDDLLGALRYAQKIVTSIRSENLSPQQVMEARWLRGEILLRMGSLEGIEDLQAVFDINHQQNGNKLNLVLISLRLASIYHEHGKTEELRKLAGSLAPLLGNVAADNKTLRGAHTEFRSVLFRGELSREVLEHTYRSVLDADRGAPLVARIAFGLRRFP